MDNANIKIKRIGILGAGSWGTAISILLGKKGYDVLLWCRKSELMKEIKDKGENSNYLPGVKIPRNVIATKNIFEAASSDLVVICIPCEYFRSTLKKISKSVRKDSVFLSASKGFEPDTCKRMSQIIKEELKANFIAVLSGPNHAEEVSRGLPTATVIASNNARIAETLKDVFSSNNFKVYAHKDIIGVEVCGAIKNIIAIAVGICDGLSFGDNAKGALITLGLREMNNFGRAFGAKQSTCYGLAGVGDLITTCESRHSRNRFVGMKLAEGKNLAEIKKEMKGMVAEGVVTSKAVYEISKRKDIKMPLAGQVYKIIYKGKDLKKAIYDLFGSI